LYALTILLGLSLLLSHFITVRSHRAEQLKRKFQHVAPFVIAGLWYATAAMPWQMLSTTLIVISWIGIAAGLFVLTKIAARKTRAFVSKLLSEMKAPQTSEQPAKLRQATPA
jgi:hypothetical protein